MNTDNQIKPQAFIDFWDRLPENERLLVDVLRQIVLETLPTTCKERFAYNVPFYYGKRRICLIWPASVPRGGFKTGVFLGFNQGYKLADVNQYLLHGTNKQIYYRIFHTPEEIDEEKIVVLLKEAIELDKQFK
jgi:hypothetical protein